MLKFLLNKIAPIFARKIASYIAIGVTFITLKGCAYLAAKYPPIASLCDPEAIANWITIALAAIFNDLGNKATVRNYSSAVSSEVSAIAAELLHTNPMPIKRAEPADEKL